MLWSLFTLIAAFSQALRNAQQKRLSVEIDALGVTLARFLWAPPLAFGYLGLLYVLDPAPLPGFGLGFILPASAGALAQIIATLLMVRLFQRRSYTAGVGLAKSEALFAALLGVAFFAAQLGVVGWLGVAVGAVAVWLLKGRSAPGDLDLTTLALGLGSGVCFALTTLLVRQATLTLDAPFMQAAAWALVWNVCLQVVVLVVWLAIRSPSTIGKLLARPRAVFGVSLSSSLASLCWFSALTLQDAALVKTLGQVEVLFTLLLSRHWLRERVGGRERLGLLLVALGALLVLWPSLAAHL
ncbi:EamA family transporter [Halotalea alkalilenta]|uniref:EamA family transporter n=1 Tax=Halotalea alkalilenta TaxID=376489 RepID=UPI0004882DB2|nr:EamA family transporter [Halotalea alkalilenta]